MTNSLGILPHKENRAVTAVSLKPTHEASVDVCRRILHTDCISLLVSILKLAVFKSSVFSYLWLLFLATFG